MYTIWQLSPYRKIVAILYNIPGSVSIYVLTKNCPETVWRDRLNLNPYWNKPNDTHYSFLCPLLEWQPDDIFFQWVHKNNAILKKKSNCIEHQGAIEAEHRCMYPISVLSLHPTSPTRPHTHTNTVKYFTGIGLVRPPNLLLFFLFYIFFNMVIFKFFYLVNMVPFLIHYFIWLLWSFFFNYIFYLVNMVIFYLFKKILS